MKIYVVDHIGKYGGMHYYSDALKSCLMQIENIDIEILSTDKDKDQKRPFFLNQYTGNIVFKIIKLLLNFIRLFFFIQTNKKACYVYYTYGNFFEPIFLRIISLAPVHIIDIHEAISQQNNKDKNPHLKKWLKRVFKNHIKNVIAHSPRTKDYLTEFEYKGKTFEVPHFKYCFKKEYDVKLVASDITEAIATDKVNLLFFGRLTHDKGVDIFIDSVNQLSEDVRSKINVIVAGKSLDDSITRFKINSSSNSHLIDRFISDDELIYLYKFCDYVMMPYRVSSQSGILEMAFYFKKPIVTSNVAYFELMLTEFPSFGHLSKDTESSSFADIITDVVLNKSTMSYFISSEYDSFTNRKEIVDFVDEFSMWIKSNNI